MNSLTLQTSNARRLRQEQTPTETMLWISLRAGRLGGRKFRRQHSIPQSRFIADFCCTTLELIIEIDGGYHDEPEQASRDAERQMLIEEFGYTFLRFADTEVIANLPLVLRAIDEVAQTLASAMSVPHVTVSTVLMGDIRHANYVHAPKAEKALTVFKEEEHPSC